MSPALRTAPTVPPGAVGAVVGVAVRRTAPAPVPVPAPAPVPVPVPVQRTVVGVDTQLTGTGSVEDALAGLAEVLPRGAVASTHLVRGDAPHVSVSVDVVGPLHPAVVDRLAEAFAGPPLVVELLADDDVRISHDDAPAGARVAVSEVLTGTGSRAVLFPGSGVLTGELTVAEVLSRTAVDRVVDLTGAEVDGSVTVRTRDFVRPRRVARLLELTVQPARGGTVVPFEDPDPTPCCAVHAEVRGPVREPPVR